ncbi:hypothetical protein SCT_0696 [Sulfuricella sp. T08]|uniref:hypothetical protein n=1 Tax=Sulfuricella sp. T08 TaxID=1632857 RepID=UPI00061799CA|nr:hypothetical protein [Sulfuricella sp. T08]GAO35311.1 hypothetical protein SCT_0696 [Sulfuricella sp. T08]
MADESSDLIEIRIEFERGAGDPTRVFRAMAGLIESTQLLDSHLALIIGANVRTALVLQDVEAASLKAKLKTIIEEIPDEAVKAGDVKKVIGHFLFKAKHKILDWCSERNSIKDRGEIKQLEADIHALAEQSDIKVLPAYASLETATLLSDINSVKGALEYLENNDVATFKSPLGSSEFNPELTVPDDVVRELITRETIASKGERILKVKKPDYLGSSKWVFKYGGHLIEAKVIDGEWLNRFQNNHDPVFPGDSLRVVLREEASYGYDNEIVHTDYEVVQVVEVIRGLRLVQDTML